MLRTIYHMSELNGPLIWRRPPGVVEYLRLIKSTKRCLGKTTGQAKLSYDEMHTAIVEIEAIINSQPLSYVSSDDTEEPLTPSHLLVGCRILSLPDNFNYLELDDFEVGDVSVQR